MKKYSIKWTETAKNDLNDIINYIAIDSINNAIKQYERIKEAALSLSYFPNQGRIIPELSKHNIIKYKERIIDPWRMMYKIENKEIYIMAIIDGRRNIEDILMRRQIR